MSKEETKITQATEEVLALLEGYCSKHEKIIASSSFQTQSLPLLHMISQLSKKIPIAFLDTGYHFPETLIFLKKIEKLLDLKIIMVKPLTSKIHQLDSSGRLLYSSDPDLCCEINKVEPQESLLKDFDIWISGVRSDQNKNRSQLEQITKTPSGVIRLHPLLFWTQDMVDSYIEKYNLPLHPMEKLGFKSIGCSPCTHRGSSDKKSRASRWAGMNKTECGLHTRLVTKK